MEPSLSLIHISGGRQCEASRQARRRNFHRAAGRQTDHRRAADVHVERVIGADRQSGGTDGQEQITRKGESVLRSPKEQRAVGINFKIRAAGRGRVSIRPGTDGVGAGRSGDAAVALHVIVGGCRVDDQRERAGETEPCAIQRICAAGGERQRQFASNSGGGDDQCTCLLYTSRCV